MLPSGLVLASLAAALAPFGWPFELFAHFRWQLAAAAVVLGVLCVLLRDARGLAAIALAGSLQWLGYAQSDAQAPPLAANCSGPQFRLTSINLWFRHGQPQRVLYELVLASQHAAIDATKEGARFTDPHDATVKVLAQGMLDVGLLDRDKVGTLDDVIEKRAYFQFYMHRTGHWLGMDVHDCGSYIEPSQVGEVSERKDPLSGEIIKNRPARLLKPGMVLTIEPGIYVRPAEGVPEQFHNIGIRIEDDAIVTASGCELISRGVPVDPDEIEALMRA